MVDFENRKSKKPDRFTMPDISFRCRSILRPLNMQNRAGADVWHFKRGVIFKKRRFQNNSVFIRITVWGIASNPAVDCLWALIALEVCALLTFEIWKKHWYKVRITFVSMHYGYLWILNEISQWHFYNSYYHFCLFVFLKERLPFEGWMRSKALVGACWWYKPYSIIKYADGWFWKPKIEKARPFYNARHQLPV